MKLKDFVRYTPPQKTSPEQSEDSGSFWDSAIDFAEKWILPTALPAVNFARSSAPALLGGTGAEIVGNVAKSLADNFPENSWRRNLLESISSGAQNVADTSLKIGSNKVEVGDNDTYRGSFGNAFESGAYGVLGGLASMVHADKSANALNNAAQALTDQTPIDPAFSLDYFISPHGLTRSFGQTLGSMASIAPTMFLVPEATAMRGVAALGGDALTNFLVNRGLFGVAKQFAKGAPNAFRYATTSPFVEGGAEGGNVRTSALEQGLSEEEATRRSINTMEANVPTLVASNFVEGLLLGAPFLRGGSTFQKALQGAARWQLNAAQQGIEEGTQRGIQDWQLGRPYSFNPFNYSPEQAQEAWEGYFGTLPMGVAPAVSHVVSRPDTGVQNWERGSDEKISNKDFSTRATQATNKNSAYLGENGAGENKTWIRNPNMNVSTEGMRPESLNALDMLGKWFYDRTGTPLILNAGTNGDHAAGEFSHANGWKFDIIDQLDGDGALFTADYRAQPLLKEFIEYGRSLGLGMNLEAEGTSNVHLDVAVDSTQWDGNGDHAGGFNPRGAKNTSQESSARGNSYDNNFSARQNEIWQAAQYASARAKEKHDIDIPAWLIYRQWAYEAGEDFDSPNARHNNNFGGLTQVEPNGEENKQPDGNNYYRHFNSVQEYADAYVDDFIKYRPELNGVKTVEDFAQIMKDTGYYGNTVENYIAGMKRGGYPNAGRATSMGAPSSRTTQPTQQNNQQQTSQQETNPLFDINAEDNATQKLFEQFAEERRRSSQDATEVDFFDGMFTDKGKFQNTPENRDAIRQNYSNEFSAWAIAQLQQNQQQSQPTQPATTQTQQGNEYLNNAPIIETADKFLAQLRTKGNDNKTLLELQEARNSGDIAKIENILKQHNVPISSPQNQQTAQPVQSNTTPENVLPSQTQTAPQQTQSAQAQTQSAQSSPQQQTQPQISQGTQDRLNRAATSPISAKRSERIKQGKAIKALSAQNNITLPQPVDIALDNGSVKGIQAAQEIIREQLPQQQTANAQPTIIQPQQQRTVKPWNPPRISHTEAQLQNQQAQQIQQQQIQSQEPTVQQATQAQTQPSQSTLQNQEQTLQPQEQVTTPQSTAQQQSTLQNQQQTLQSQSAQSQPTTTQPQPTISSKIRGHDGKQAKVVTQSKTKHNVRYRVVESDDLLASGELTSQGVFNNDEYSNRGGIQPRDRTTQELQADLYSQANNIDPDLALDSGLSVNSGAPVIRNDGVVFNGNGRVMALTYAYKNGKADAYKQALIERADEFGLNADDIAQMNSPVLVRELTNDVTQEELNDIAGTTAGGAASVADEQAFKDAKKITPETLQLFPKTEIDEKVDLTAAKFDDFVAAVLHDIATSDEMPALSKNGKLTKAGLDRVQRALFALAYGDPKLVETVSTSTDDTARNVTAALTSSAIEFAKVRAGIESGDLANYDLSAITDAVNKLAALRKQNKPVKDYLNEIKLGEQDSEEMRQILSALDKFKRSQPKLTQFLKGLARRMREQGSTADTLFGAAEPAAMLDLINQSRNAVASNNEADLLAQQEEQSNATSQTTKTPQSSRTEENSVQDAESRQTQAQEVAESKPKAKRKWHTIGSAGSREDLQKLIRENFGNNSLVIEDDGTVHNTKNGRNLSSIVRNHRGRWQFGYYENEQSKSSSETTTTKTSKQPQNSEEDISDEEFRLLSLTPETLEVDDQLKETLYKKFPNIKEAIDTLIEIANSPLQHDYRKDTPRKNARERLLSLLRAKTQKTNIETLPVWAADKLFYIWDTEKLAKRNKSAKTERIRENVKDIFKDFNDKKLTAQELYQKIGELLYPKHFAKAQSKTQSESDNGNSSREEYMQSLDAKAEEFFDKFESIDMQDRPYFGAKIKDSVLPSGNRGITTPSIQKEFDELAKFYGGRTVGREFRFTTAEARDNFVRQITQEELLETEISIQQQKIQAQEKADNAKRVKRDKINKIISDAKEKAYQILEANKYPEIKNFVDRQVEAGMKKHKVDTVEAAEDFAKKIAETVRSYKNEGHLSNAVLLEVLNQWYDSRPTDSRGGHSKRDYDKRSIAMDIISQAEKGEFTLDEAYEEINHFLKTGKRKNLGRTTTRINDAAKNSDVARALEQLGATVKNGKVTYPDDETFQACVKLVNSGIVKSSQEGNTSTKIENFVDVKDLNPLQRAYAAFAKEMGVPIIFFRGNKNFHGAHANGISYYNVDATFSHEFVYWHEFGHWLKNNQPQLFQEMLDAADITKAQLDEKRNSRPELTDDELKEEIICDAMSDIARRTGLLNQIGKKNSSLIQRIISWAKTTLDRFTDWFNRKEFGLTNAQRDRMKDVFGKGVRQITDGNGNKIFRYNNRTHEIELVDGSKLPTVQNSAKPKYSTDAENKKAATERDSKPNTASDEEYLQAVNDFKNAKTDEQRRSTFRKLQDMVQRAAEAAGFTNAIPEQTVAYKVRTGAAPKKTIKVYKVFTVANDGSPTALFVGGTEKLPQGVWLDAQDAYHFKAKNGKYYVPSTQNPFTKGGKTGASVEIPDEATRQELIKRGFLPEGSKATKITALAYRPGWHAGTLPFFPQGGVKPKSGTTSAYPNIHRYNQVVFECELAAEKNFTAEAEAQPKARTKDGKLNTREADLQYMPENGFYYYATNPMTHGHPELGMWAISGSLKINRALTQEECDKILADNNMAPQEWEQGKMNLADLGYTGEQNDVARKTVAPITYDDNSEVIPLSQRFDASRNDIRYSLDASDNGNESFLQRIKNFISGRPRNQRIHKTMKRQLEDLSKMKIAAGHLPEGVQVKIDEIAKVIRTGREYDWLNILPAVGNEVAKQLGITQSAQMGNYIGKYLFDGAPNDTSAEAKEFAKAMRDNPDMREKILEVRDTFATWNSMSYEEQMRSSVQYEDEVAPLKDRAKEFWRHFRTQFVDSQLPIHYHVEKFEQATGMKLAHSINPVTAFRNLRGMGARAYRMIYGTELSVKVLQRFYPNVKFDKFKTIATILESIGASPETQTYKDFDVYIKACHFLDIHKRNNENLQQQAAVRDKIKKLQEDLKNATDKNQRKQIEKAIKKLDAALDSLQRDFMQTPETFSEERCTKFIEKHKDKFESAKQDMVRYSRTLLAILADSGIISYGHFKQLLKAYPNYVPLHREFDENADIGAADSMKHMLGSSKDMGDSIRAIVNNTFDFVRRAEKNKAKLQLANLSNFDGVGGIFEEVEKGTNDGTIITFFENGKRKYLQCADKTIVAAVNNMNVPSMNLFMRILRVPTKILRGAATYLNPNFMYRNILRDPQDAYIYSKKYGGNVFLELLKAMTPYNAAIGLTHALNMDEIYEEYMISGGAQGNFFSFDKNYEQETIEKLTKRKYTRFASPKGVLKLLETLGEYSELATRLSHFDKVKTSLAKEHNGVNIYDDLVTAALETRDLIDFARYGEAGRTWNAVAVFANPAIQGWDKFFRTFDYKKIKKFGGTDETQKEWIMSTVKLGLTMLPAIVLALLNHDKDWYRDDVQDWERETHWILSEDVRIPKGADIGLRFFSNLIESMLNWGLNNDPVTTKKALQPFLTSLPDIMPTALLPIFECIANYDMFRRNSIVPIGEQLTLKGAPELQYDSQNSNLAVYLGKKFGVSPRLIDHFIYGHTGNMGRGLLRATDTATYGLGLTENRPPAFTRDWRPITGGLYRVPYRNPKIVTDYYNELDRQESFVRAYKLEKQQNKNAKISDDYDRTLHARLKGAKKYMQALSKQERAVMEDPKLTSEQVEEKRKAIQDKRIELCRKVFQRAR